MRMVLLLFALFLAACTNDFEVIEDLSGKEYTLINQSGKEVIFPQNIKGKIGVVGYIFTNCPDICPLTTNNMRLVQEKLKAEGIKNVEFVSISFDPEVDKPEILNKYAELRDLDVSNWEFLTGKNEIVKGLMKDIGIVAIKGDSTVTPKGEIIYYYVHTDRISLFDTEGRIVKNYPGSSVQINDIVNDVKKIGD